MGSQFFARACERPHITPKVAAADVARRGQNFAAAGGRRRQHQPRGAPPLYSRTLRRPLKLSVARREARLVNARSRTGPDRPGATDRLAQIGLRRAGLLNGRAGRERRGDCPAYAAGPRISQPTASRVEWRCLTGSPSTALGLSVRTSSRTWPRPEPTHGLLTAGLVPPTTAIA